MKDLSQRTDQPGMPPMRFNKQVSVFLVCFIIAAVFWILLALSRNYPSTLTFPVKYSNLPKKKVIVNELPESITLQLNASGFDILSYQFSSNQKPILIDVVAGMRSSGPYTDALAVPTRKFLNDFTHQLGKDIEIIGFSPDSIVLMFSDRVSKKVRIIPDVIFNLDRQFDTLTSPYTSPDSVMISGPPSAIRKIRSLKTSPLQFPSLHAPINQEVELQLPPMVEAESATVRLHIDVEEFTEGQQSINVHSFNVPAGYSLRIFPEKVDVRYQVALSKFKSVSADQFEVVVDAGSLPKSTINLLPLRLVSSPPGVRMISLSPAEVEFILRKK